MSELAIACSLSGGDQAKRLEEIADLTRRALLETLETTDGLRLRFAAQPGVRSELEQLIEAESRCCSFLRFTLNPDDDDLVLDVSGPKEARPLIDEMFCPPAPSATGR